MDYEKEMEKNFCLGYEMCGNLKFAVDLKYAMMTGKDLDEADIPGDTPEERNPKKEIISKKKEGVEHER